MKSERAQVLAYNAIVMLMERLECPEEETQEFLEKELGITQEELLELGIHDFDTQKTN